MKNRNNKLLFLVSSFALSCMASASFTPTFILSATPSYSPSATGTGFTQSASSTPQTAASVTASLTTSINLNSQNTTISPGASFYPSLSLSVSDSGSYSKTSFNVIAIVEIKRSVSNSLTVYNPSHLGGAHASSTAWNYLQQASMLKAAIADDLPRDYSGGTATPSAGPTSSFIKLIIPVSKVGSNYTGTITFPNSFGGVHTSNVSGYYNVIITGTLSTSTTFSVTNIVVQP